MSSVALLLKACEVPKWKIYRLNNIRNIFLFLGRYIYNYIAIWSVWVGLSYGTDIHKSKHTHTHTQTHTQENTNEKI